MHANDELHADRGEVLDAGVALEAERAMHMVQFLRGYLPTLTVGASRRERDRVKGCVDQQLAEMAASPAAASTRQKWTEVLKAYAMFQQDLKRDEAAEKELR